MYDIEPKGELTGRDSETLSKSELDVIQFLVKAKKSGVSDIVSTTHKNRTYISKLLSGLLEKKCVVAYKSGKRYTK